MKITEITKSDFEPLKILYLKERQRTFSWLDTSEFKLDDFEKHTQGEYILVAHINEIPVGFISIWMPNNFIHHLYVDQEYQGQKVGTELLKAAIQKTKFPLTLKCLENNIKAVEFYNKTGFIEKEKGRSENGTYILFELSKDIN
ncbi:Ribosomal protein S18 acetylase RimI [Flavobacterium sp. CF108]|uniref:GNAT family N-acetyltransferase n=1 Tax=unclassified Flavobacterium TaxID=196869 RepID=UPI0008D21D51|nr:MULTISPECIES: GNAT family N-acetyltransferase [unclassified Flavobacterium]SEN95429.1 Ribosomal protein S18 acetylase RimI [Flavobacterium sp. fv08]SHH29633.1 Ribosomal protein S18 acetylase RimI [Flavobacterium sp. CF108]